jgi:hypothetical protein
MTTGVNFDSVFAAGSGASGMLVAVVDSTAPTTNENIYETGNALWVLQPVPPTQYGADTVNNRVIAEQGRFVSYTITNVTATAIGTTGATGDFWHLLSVVGGGANGVLVAAFLIYDGTTLLQTYPIGASPFNLIIDGVSNVGAWKVTVGASDRIWVNGRFT